MDEPIKLYTAEEVAEMLNTSIDFIYDRIQDHTFRCYRFGRNRRFSMVQIKDFMEKMEINK